jgi:6-phosphogluconolactonase
MTQRIVRTFVDAEAVCQTAAAEFVCCATEALATHGRFFVALSGGSTPRRLFQLLQDQPFRSKLDWKNVEVFWGDERCVPPDHQDSNYRMAREAMLESVPIPTRQVHRIEAERPDRAGAARDYQLEIARAFGLDPAAHAEPPRFDLILLGMGPDGHTASLFPYTTALKETTSWVVVNHVPKFGADRITLTAPILNRARQILFLVAGADKAEPLAEVLEGSPQPEKFPSQLINPVDGQICWFVDRLAAAQLTTITGLTDTPPEDQAP